jgi:hypothetical protein
LQKVISNSLHITESVFLYEIHATRVRLLRTAKNTLVLHSVTAIMHGRLILGKWWGPAPPLAIGPNQRLPVKLHLTTQQPYVAHCAYLSMLQ